MAGRKGKPGEKSASPSWDVHEIQELLDVLIKREIAEFEFEKSGVKVRVRRGNIQAESSVPASYVENSFLPPPPPPRPAPEMHHAGTLGADTAASESTDGLFIIKSPIVGTFFASPSPNAPPFAKVGDTVQVGQVLCIIEAMKLMNEIESEVAGEVVRVYVENGQPVEYSQSLFAIRPSHKK
jgi:acetyl-CoA carboxylase biotin carboxyl carrier protein